MARKTRQEYEATRVTEPIFLRVSPEDAELFRQRVDAAGGAAGDYFVALLRSRATPERDLRDLARLTALIASLNQIATKLQGVRNEVSKGFGLMKQTFISEPALAARSQAELDYATGEARRVIALARQTVTAVEAQLDAPISDVRAAILALRAGKL